MTEITVTKVPTMKVMTTNDDACIYDDEAVRNTKTMDHGQTRMMAMLMITMLMRNGER